jgi:hypothetical protein
MAECNQPEKQLLPLQVPKNKLTKSHLALREGLKTRHS